MTPTALPTLGKPVFGKDVTAEDVTEMKVRRALLSDEEVPLFNPLHSKIVHRSVLGGLLALSLSFLVLNPSSSRLPRSVAHVVNSVQGVQAVLNEVVSAPSASDIATKEEIASVKIAPQGVISAGLSSKSEADRSEKIPLTDDPFNGKDTLSVGDKDESVVGALSTIEPAPESDTKEGKPELGVSVVTHVIKSKETLSVIWKSHGAPSVGGAKALEAFKESGVSLSSFRPGDALTLSVKDSDIVAITKKLSNGNEVTLQGDSKNGYKALLKKVTIIENERTVRGTIRTSFSASARSSSVPYPVIDELVDLFSNRLEFRKDLQPGDSFTITYMERRAGESGNELEPGHIVAASLTSSGAMLAAIRHTGKDGTARFYDETGGVLGDYFLRYPVQFSRISSVFSTARFHPVLKFSRPHNGVDFAAPIGTPVRSVADGIVIEAGYHGEAGNMIKIAHGSRFSTAYLHLSKISSALKKGAHISRGQVIGAVGMTGLATGPHLHFSFYDSGKYVDPLKMKLPELRANEERLPKQILITALNALKSSTDTKYLADVGGKNKRG